MNSFIPLARAECDDSLPFSGASSIPLCYVLFPATLLHQLLFHLFPPNLAIYFLVCLSILFLDSYITLLFWESYFLPFSVHAQTNVIYLNDTMNVRKKSENCGRSCNSLDGFLPATVSLDRSKPRQYRWLSGLWAGI